MEAEIFPDVSKSKLIEILFEVGEKIINIILVVGQLKVHLPPFSKALIQYRYSRKLWKAFKWTLSWDFFHV